MLSRSESRLNLSLACGLLLAVAAPTARGQCQVTETGQCNATDGAGGDSFGRAVSISGDVAIIGAPRDADAGFQSGSAYIHRFDGTNWVEEAKLTASDGAAGDNFGNSVAISGDVAVVGAPLDNDAAPFSGSAYVFRYNGVDWLEEQKLNASDPSPANQLGWSVDVEGNEVLVGAISLVGSGSVYSFRFDGESWLQEQKLTPSDGAPEDHFGESVSISGSRATIGAYLNDGAGLDSGAVYVFHFNGTSWVQETKLVGSDTTAGDEFGRSVSIDGNVAIISARGDDDNGMDSGSVYVFRFDGANWSQPEEAKLTASDGAPADRFGHSLAIDGNVAIVGAIGVKDNGTGSGAAYIYSFDVSSWVEDAKLLASNGASSDVFGTSVAMEAGRAIIGATGADGVTSGSGSAYVFDGLPNVCCPWDLSGNMSVDVPDLLGLLAAWGTDPGGPPDFDGDANVAVPDLLALLAHWGPCP